MYLASFVLALSFCGQSLAQLTQKTQKIYSCDVTEYPGVMYKLDNILGENKWWDADTFQGCVEECLQKPGCKAINFIESDALCGLYSSGITSVDAPKNTYDRYKESIHALISCPLKKPSGPVGCGRQAAAYQPILNKSHRIIGGTEAKPNSWPWLVTMKIDLGGGYGATCGSSLIRVKDNVDASDILVTAAHCVTKEKTMATNPQAFAPSQIEVIAGNHRMKKYDDGEELRQVSQIRFHSAFRFTGYTGAVNDLALLKLETPIQFTDTIRPICLPTAGEALPVGQTCVAAGWGRNNSRTDDIPEALQQLLAPVYDAKTCKGTGTGWGQLYKEDLMVCAGSLQGKSGTCQGDSGGTLACQQTDGSWRLYGATSFGVAGSCLDAGKPGIFTRISSYMDWITKNVNEMSSM